MLIGVFIRRLFYMDKADIVSQLAVNILFEEVVPAVSSLVTEADDLVVAHVAY